MELNTWRSNAKYIVAIIIILLGCLFIYQFFLAGWLSEGNPSITFWEINETIASSGNIVHLSDQEYKEFPGMKEIVENQNDADQFWKEGKRYLGWGRKITEEQSSSIQRKYQQETDFKNGDYLEHNGKYYSFRIRLS